MLEATDNACTAMLQAFRRLRALRGPDPCPLGRNLNLNKKKEALDRIQKTREELGRKVCKTYLDLDVGQPSAFATLLEDWLDCLRTLDQLAALIQLAPDDDLKPAQIDVPPVR